MPQINLITAYNGRPRVGLPSTRLINALVEPSPAGPSQTMRTTRPGLVLWNTLGNGPILRQFQMPGVHENAVVSISGGELYHNADLVGPISYGTNPRMAAAGIQIAIVSGGGLYVHTSSGGTETLTQVLYFDDGVSRLPSFSSVAVLYNIFIYTVAGSNQFFFSSVGDATIINAANFSSAQTSPDPIVEVQVLAEELYFFKPTAVEIWDYTGVLTAPFALSQGRTYSRGCNAQGSVVTKVDNSLFWVADDLSVYRSSNIPIKISTPYVDDRLQSIGPVGIQSVTAFYLGVEGHALYVLNLPTINETLVYDAATKEWGAWGTQNSYEDEPSLFIGNTSTGQTSTDLFVGDYRNGNVYIVSPTIYSDNNSPLSTVVSGAILIQGGQRRCNNVSIQCVRGEGTYTKNPIIWMRYSDDGARTWSSWLEGNIGFAGDYEWKAIWNFLGHMNQPGRYFEWYISDTVPFTVQSAMYNEYFL